MPTIITLLTDFGLSDVYVGTMKGVILSINPDAEIVDLTHEVSPQNIVQAAYLLGSAYSYFPPETIHVAVVDPGVGTNRLPIAARVGKWKFIAPDNSILSDVIRAESSFEAYELSNPKFRLQEVSHTFHGRDIFAPAAAYLSLGASLEEFGPRLTNPIILSPAPQPEGDAFYGKVIHIDRFGNCITDIEETTFAAWADGEISIKVDGKPVQELVDTYGDIHPGEAAALFGSSGRLEIAVNMGSAASALNLSFGSVVLVQRRCG